MAIAGSDWRDSAAYANLLNGERRCFAWEWLRRSSDYAFAWSEQTPPQRFGLVRLEDPARDAVRARPIWSASVDRAVLRGQALSSGGGDRLDLAALAPLATIVAAADRPVRHLLLSEGLRSVRVDLSGTAALSHPIVPIWQIEGMHDIGPQLTALAQLVAVARTGRFSRSLHRPERRARRWIAMLRVHDALAAGASHRDIVAGLFGIDVSEPRWRSGFGGSWRLRVQRLAAGARSCLAAGPHGWLGKQG